MLWLSAYSTSWNLLSTWRMVYMLFWFSFVLLRHSKMNRTTGTRTSKKAQADSSRNQGVQKVVSRPDVGRVRQISRIRGCRIVRTVSFNASIYGHWCMIVIEYKENWANKEQEEVTSTESDDLDAMPSRPRLLLTKELLAGELSRPITNVNYIWLA